MLIIGVRFALFLSSVFGSARFWRPAKATTQRPSRGGCFDLRGREGGPPRGGAWNRHRLLVHAPHEGAAIGHWGGLTDVPGWSRWDTVEAPRIDGPFLLGARGATTSQGMEPAFEVTALVGQEAYELTFPLLGGALLLHRSFDADPSRTLFTHRVRFTGESGAAIAPTLTPGFRAALPRVMDALRRLAEGR